MLRISLVTLLLIGFVAAIGCETCRISGGAWCTREGFAPVCRVGGCPEGFCEETECFHPQCCPVCQSNYNFVNTTFLSSVTTAPVCYQLANTGECNVDQIRGWVVFQDTIATTCSVANNITYQFPEDECYNVAGPNLGVVPRNLSTCPNINTPGYSYVVLKDNQHVAWRRFGDKNVTFDINQPGNVPTCDSLCPDTTVTAACIALPPAAPFLLCDSCPENGENVCGAVLPLRGCTPGAPIQPRDICESFDDCASCTTYVEPGTINTPCSWTFETCDCYRTPLIDAPTPWYEVDTLAGCAINNLPCNYQCPVINDLLGYFKSLFLTSSDATFNTAVTLATEICNDAGNGIPGINCTTGVFNVSNHNIAFDFPYDFFCAINQIPIPDVWKTIDLSYNLIGGVIPPTIGVLGNIQFLHLEYNRIVGPLPDALCCLTHVQYLYVDHNCLSGCGLPECLCDLTNIQEVHFNSNRKLVGFLPACWVGVPSLFEMHAECTALREPYPGYLEFLRETRVQPNDVEKTFPDLGYYDCGLTRCCTECSAREEP